jgi:hypothetical protein
LKVAALQRQSLKEFCTLGAFQARCLSRQPMIQTAWKALDLDYSPPTEEAAADLIRGKSEELYQKCVQAAMIIKVKEDDQLMKQKEKTTKKVEEVAKLSPDKWLDAAIDQRLSSWGLRQQNGKGTGKPAGGAAGKSTLSASKIFVESTMGDLRQTTLEEVAKNGVSPVKSGGSTDANTQVRQGQKPAKGKGKGKARDKGNGKGKDGQPKPIPKQLNKGDTKGKSKGKSKGKPAEQKGKSKGKGSGGKK